MTNMRFAVTTPQMAPWADLLETVRFLDRETAFDAAFVVDHFVPGAQGEDPRGITFDGWTALAALAQATERTRLGVLVTGVTYRNPSLLAKIAVTADHISNGRLELGIGAAWHEEEHRMYGFDFPPVRERQDRLDECVQVLRLLMSAGDNRVSFDGKHYQLRDAVFDPPPVQRPWPPILVGGEGEKRTLRTLARYGDIMDIGGTPAMVRRKIEVVERHCRDAGRDPSEIMCQYRGPIVVSDNPGTVDRVAQMTAQGYGITPDDVKREMPIGTASHVRACVERYAEAGVSRMVMLSGPPWRTDVFRRIDAEIVRAFT